ncbi:TIGR03087 family PEP-CTERM/XrtA system glycosyltransferase [Sphingosinicella rhizophila]|uniref:TIGR03087 family PEP-CTERM/XrtA system glycosyltransferase n=1 Tax=Sphingosinicella rhizophila TaxID=3050082 RepID=A0ABU3Q3X3_9SPHN|nr:TIGR03087 family PEP-CTERM/XrtA system glycosyltransferase [Sphingosinicella sp. GR2756]MDT9597754.1 TIGR03087 family PEP-CTERM/XrtA system glycosyltransferase [Sphingosinicella sp. GR2756]
MMDDILFLAHRIPFPPDRGDRIRSWNIIRHLATLTRVHLACFADEEADLGHLGALRQALGATLGEVHVEIRRRSRVSAGLAALVSGRPISLTSFDNASLRAFVAKLIEREPVGTIFAFSGQMAQFVPEAGAQRFIMDFVDMDSAKFAAFAEGASTPMRWVYRREAERLFAFERKTAARADTSLFVSEAEVMLFRDRAGLAHADIRALENGVDLQFYDPASVFEGLANQSQGPLIVFTGQMNYRPNIEAVTLFARDIFPRIRQNVPGARFAIVGRQPSDAVKRLADGDAVVVTGAVEDVRPWLLAANVVVAPLQVARGIQNKVLEAMAMGRPVVASPAAFEGIDAVPGRDLIVAAPDSQADAVISLLEDARQAQAMGKAARRHMQMAYPWAAKLAALTDMLSAPPRRQAA